ncbi:MAG: hypothetical protein JJE07_14590, partial [Flavobacteriaceae bacterium]|nr:hypothetical protein [Flavobacteriaceae bacterium]
MPNSNVLIAPFYLNGEKKHAKKSENLKKVFPFWIPASLNEDGELKYLDEENKLPWFIRSVLEPVCSETNYLPIISSIKDVDNVL